MGRLAPCVVVGSASGDAGILYGAIRVDPSGSPYPSAHCLMIAQATKLPSNATHRPARTPRNHASHHGSWGSVHAQLLHVSVHARLLHGDPVGHQRIAEHAGKYDKRLDRALSEFVLELLLH